MSECTICGSKGCAVCGRPHDTFGWSEERCLSRFAVDEVEKPHPSVVPPLRTYVDRLELHAKQREDGAWEGSVYRPEYDHYNMLELGMTLVSGILPTRARAEQFARDGLAMLRRRDREREAAR